jgi:hypothetical protein
MRPREIAAWTIAVVGFVAFLASATLECGQPVCSSFRAVAGGAWGDLVNHAAAISAVAAATALILNVISLRKTHLSNSAKMVLDLYGRFDAKEMRALRKAFSVRLLDTETPLDLIIEETAVLDFLEDIGHQTKRDVLDGDGPHGVWVVRRRVLSSGHIAKGLACRGSSKGPAFLWRIGVA